MRYIRFHLVLLAALPFLLLSRTVPARADDTVKIAHSTWVGYGPLYIARDKGSAFRR
jgi:NitT/TauT family transport system substrate-binding protein